MWQDNYEKLSSGDQKMFSDCINKLLAVNYLVKTKSDNASMYYFINKNQELFAEFLKIIDWDLDVNPDLGVISVRNNLNRNRMNLKLNETIVLLILRLLYEQNSDEINIENHVEIKMSDIHEMFAIVGLENRILTKTALVEILAFFRRFNLINVENLSQITTKDPLYILPSILKAVETTSIDDVYKRISGFTEAGGDEFENTEED